MLENLYVNSFKFHFIVNIIMNIIMCGHLRLAFPLNFVDWVNLFSWIIILAIVSEINTNDFLSNVNRSPTNGIIVIGFEFETHLGNIGGRLLTYTYNTPFEFRDMGVTPKTRRHHVMR